MTTIKLCSLNTRGLGDYKKRRDVLNYLRTNKYSIVCLQDTHFTPSLITQVELEWGYKCFHSTFASNSRGTSVFINNNFEFKLNEIKQDKNGKDIYPDCYVCGYQIEKQESNRGNYKLINKELIV